MDTDRVVVLEDQSRYRNGLIYMRHGVIVWGYYYVEEKAGQIYGYYLYDTISK